ncbi:MAG: excinuclease ABC subunit UvrB [Alphaproteobacteria bacterium GM7ARS4]|nr:excinuclease ABC subunit UvrB [Alphaproteobacteria bacterium GM7ARS4]
MVTSSPTEKPFRLVSDFSLAGDQPSACAQLTHAIAQHEKNLVLLGVTGSGKTFTIAHTIEKLQRPTLIIAPNKTLAAQLFEEMRGFFPHNAVNYFVSYYDYYQPEAYVPGRDLYIEKESTTNEHIDRMRHAATRALLERKDVIVVASVSCIYGIGDKDTYGRMTISLRKGQTWEQTTLLRHIVALHYKRNDTHFHRGTFRVRGDNIELFPSHYEDKAWRIAFDDDVIETISEFDPLTGALSAHRDHIHIYSNSHYVTTKPALTRAMTSIRQELLEQKKRFLQENKLLEAQRIEQRTQFDLEMMAATGSCQGIENYSRHLTGRAPGKPPPTLFEYLPDNALLVIDESHVTVPQLGGMYRGDYKRKSTLAQYGFRLPSCVDNRPLTFEEWDAMRPQTIFVSATPGSWELERTQGAVIEQIVRPTGLADPPCIVRPADHQVDDLIKECRAVIKKGQRVLVTTLTKRMAEMLSDYLLELDIKVRYMHSDIDTLERIDIIRQLRQGTIDVLVGINLLREGLDIPECALVAILDADKQGFLRSKTSLIQTIGRAARNIEGRAILYADTITASMQYAISESTRRREKQEAFNKEHNITPQTIVKTMHNDAYTPFDKDYLTIDTEQPTHATTRTENGQHRPAHDRKETREERERLKKEMLDAADNLDFERAALLRDTLRQLEHEDIMPLAKTQAKTTA